MSDEPQPKVVITSASMDSTGGHPRWEITAERFSSRTDYRASPHRNPTAADLPADVRQAIAEWVAS